MSNNAFQDNYDYSDIDNYIFQKTIGMGTFGKVKLAIFKYTKEKFAIKILNKEKIKEKMKNASFKENEIITKLNHINIVNVINIIEDTENFYIIMEYCNGGELFDYIVSKERLSEKESSIFFYQIINGVEYIHSQGFAHRDLKPENILISRKNNKNILKIIDFGLSHEYDEFNGELLKTKCGSPSYAAPELIKGIPYNGFKIDVWCCGIILYAMLCGYLPFGGENNKVLFKKIIECNPEIPEILSSEAKQLLYQILVPNPEKRISIEEIKVSEFYLKGKELFNIIYSDDYFFGNINGSKENDKNLSIKKHISHEIKSINTNNTYETNKTNNTNNTNNTNSTNPNNTNERKANASYLNKNDNEISNKRHRKKLHLKINGDNISNINSINAIKMLKNNEKIINNLKINHIIKTEGNDSKSIKNDKNIIPKILGKRNINTIFPNDLFTFNKNAKSKSPDGISNNNNAGENKSGNEGKKGKYWKFFDFSINNKNTIKNKISPINYFKQNGNNNNINNNNINNNINSSEEKDHLSYFMNMKNKKNSKENTDLNYNNNFENKETIIPNNISNNISNNIFHSNDVSNTKYKHSININNSNMNNIISINNNISINTKKAFTINKDNNKKIFDLFTERMEKKIQKNQVLKTPKHISSILYKNSNNGTNIDYSNKNIIRNDNDSKDKNMTKTPSSNIMNLNISKNKDIQMNNNIYRYINTEKNKNDKIKLVLKGSNSIDDTKNRVVNESMKLSSSNNNHNRINLSRIINDFQDKNKKPEKDTRNSLYNIIYYKDNEKNSNPSSVSNNQRNSKIGLFSIKKGFINHNNNFLRDFIINNHTSHSKEKKRIKDNFNANKKSNVMPVLPLLNN